MRLRKDFGVTTLLLTINSRTLNFNFQNFPGPNSFSRNVQVPKILEKKIQDFPGGVRTALLFFRLTTATNIRPLLTLSAVVQS